MKNVNHSKGRVSLYCHFNKITKAPETSFQSLSLSQKHVRNVYCTVQEYLTKFHLIVLRIQKK